MELALIGLSVVLLILIVVVFRLRKAVDGLAPSGRAQEEKATAPKVQGDDLPVVLTAAVTAAMEQDQLIAVLSAAVAAMMEDAQSGFVVRRVRRVHTTPAWQKAGREEQIYSRM